MIVAGIVLVVAVGGWLEARREHAERTAVTSPTPVFQTGLVPSTSTRTSAPQGRMVGDIAFSFEFPAPGWEQPLGQRAISKSVVGPQDAEAIVFWTTHPGGRYPLCARLPAPSGDTPADLAASVGTVRGVEVVAGPSRITIDGHRAAHVTLEVRDDVGCDPGFFYTWPHGRCLGACWLDSRVGDTISMWFVDVRGTLLVVEAQTRVATPQLERDIGLIIGSIRIGRLPGTREVNVAERFMAARSAHDIETAMSFVDDEVTVVLMYDNAMEPLMPTIDMGRGQLSLALEAERLLGVRYRSIVCRPEQAGDGAALVSCSYVMDNDLRRIAELPPLTSAFDIRVMDGRITALSFPWLNVSYPGGAPTVGGRFIEWLEREHPAAGERMSRIVGQEWVFILNQETLDDLERLLDEYEASVGT